MGSRFRGSDGRAAALAVTPVKTGVHGFQASEQGQSRARRRLGVRSLRRPYPPGSSPPRRARSNNS